MEGLKEHARWFQEGQVGSDHLSLREVRPAVKGESGFFAKDALRKAFLGWWG